MSKKPVLIANIRANAVKWLLGGISTITAIVSFVKLMRGDFPLGTVILAFVAVANVLWLLFYIIFHKTPSSGRSGKVKYQFAQYRFPALVGIILIIAGVIAAFSAETSRTFLISSVVGTATATAKTEVPKVTMLVTTTEEYSCGINFTSTSPDIHKRSGLDIGINNNSDRDILITSVLLRPDWITASQWMGPIAISETYDVSVDRWWDQWQWSQEIAYGVVSGPTPSADDLSRVKKEDDLIWVRPDPIEVSQIAQDKYVIKSKSQERFVIQLGLTDKYKYLYGKVVVEINTDSDASLKSEPLDVAVCYEEGFASRSQPPNVAETQAVQATALSNSSTAEAGNRYAWNDLASVESGGIELRVARLVIAASPANLDIPPDTIPENATAFGEIIFNVKNNSAQRLSIYPNQFFGDVNFVGSFGQPIDGGLEPGSERMGGSWFALTDKDFKEITSFHMFITCPVDGGMGCSGPDLRLNLDLSERKDQPIPDDYSEKLFFNP